MTTKLCVLATWHQPNTEPGLGHFVKRAFDEVVQARHSREASFKTNEHRSVCCVMKSSQYIGQAHTVRCWLKVEFGEGHTI